MIKVPKQQDWDRYEKIAENYLNRGIFAGTPLTGKIMRTSAKKAYDKTGVFVPIELALAQGQFESYMGTKGRSRESNPFNVGEQDDKTTMTFKSTQEGTDAYFDLMATSYLDGKSVDSLLNNFVDYRGLRYASNENYEHQIKTQMGYIQERYMRDV